jgi:hypothetical protein
VCLPLPRGLDSAEAHDPDEFRWAGAVDLPGEVEGPAAMGGDKELAFLCRCQAPYGAWIGGVGFDLFSCWAGVLLRVVGRSVAVGAVWVGGGRLGRMRVVGGPVVRC